MTQQIKQTAATGLRWMLLGAMMGALSSTGALLGIQGFVFNLLSLAFLVLTLAGLNVLRPLNPEYEKAFRYMILSIAIALIFTVAAILLFALLPGFVLRALNYIQFLIGTALACLFVGSACRATAGLLAQAGEESTGALAKQAVVIFCVCSALSVACQLLALVPALNSVMLQANSVAAILRYFVLAAFFNQSRKCLMK